MKNRMVKKAIVSVLLASALSAGVFVGTFAVGAAYKDWSQSDSGWKYVELGSSGENMGKSGCVVTSTAILMMHSGAVSDPDFTPGKLVAFFNRVGAFDSSGSLQWGYVGKYGVDFAYHTSASLTGTQAQKTEQIKKWLDDGYYVMVRVKYGQHFVAVDSVKGSTVYIMDPGGTANDLFGFYDANGVDSIRIFKTSKSGTSAPADPPSPGLPAPPFSVLQVTEPTNPPAPDPETPPAPVQPVTEAVDTPLPDPEIPPAPAQETMTELAPPPAPDPETPPSPGFPGLAGEPVTEPLAGDAVEEPMLPPPMPSQEVILPPQVGTMDDEMYIAVSMNARTEEAVAGYQEPDTESPELFVLPEGTALRLLLVSGDFTWGLAEADSRTCWLLLEHVKY